MIKALSLLFFLFIFSSCGKELEDTLGIERWRTYTIKAGNHKTKTQVSTFEGSFVVFLAKFDYTAIYQTVDPTNQGDINKLYGFSDCTSDHHKNSARFGWRWYNNELQIFAYCYKKGTRNYKYITTIDLDTEYRYKIKADGNKYYFTVNGVEVVMDRGCSGDGGIKFHLFPYFGGDEVAPHEINIKIKEL